MGVFVYCIKVYVYLLRRQYIYERVRERRMLNEASYIEYIEYIKSILAIYQEENEEKYLDITQDVKTLEERVNDENLYLGIVGSFSSGKSTFINSVIHKNLLPTDAVQGTTVATTILKKADFDDLEIVYNNETVVRFSEYGKELLEKYQTPVDDNLFFNNERISFFEKIISWIKKILGIGVVAHLLTNNRNSLRVELFKKIISNEEMASDVKYVTLYYKDIATPHKIALVDTPGTESLNKRHNEVTKNAIDNICDAIVVIIPYDEPVSEDLLEYVNNNLSKHKDDCIFVVTKVELLGDREELPRLLRVIKKRLENGLSIESSCVIPMPTLLYLKNVDSEMQTTFLDDIPEKDKKELLVMYEDGIKKINEILEQKRNDYLGRKIVDICERVCIKLNSNLSDIISDYDRRNRILKTNVVKSLIEFENNAKKDIKKCNELMKQRCRGEMFFIQAQLSEFRSEIKNTVNGCGDSQKLLNQMDFSCRAVFDEILRLMQSYLNSIDDNFNLELKDIEKRYYKEYGRCSIKGRVKKIAVDSWDVFTDAFLLECEDMLQEKIGAIKTLIKNDTNGFFRKVKFFFSNPLNKHKEMVITHLSDALDILSQSMTDYAIDQMNLGFLQFEQDMCNVLSDMFETDRDVIETYISRTTQEIDTNFKEKAATQVCIDKLNQYIERIKATWLNREVG